MEKGLARFRVSLLCFCCGCFVALFCCAEVADSRRRSFPLRGSLPFSGANAACGCLPPQRCRNSNRVLVQCPVGSPMPPAPVCHLSAAGTPTASWFTALFGSQCRLAAVCHLSAAGTPTASWSSALSGCQCLLRLSATSAPRALQPRPGSLPFREPMPPAAVCHLSAAGTPIASWHGDHAHKYSRGIPAWRRGYLSTLWHGDPQQNHFWGRVTWQDCLEPVSNRSLADTSAGLRHGIPCERPLGGILAWRGSHLSALRP